MLQSRRKPNSVRIRSPKPAFARCAPADVDGYGVTTIPLVPSLLTGSSDLPGDSADGPSAPAVTPMATLFGLAPCGVLPATRVTTGAVRSYRTFSPLLAFALREGGRYVFCATVLRVAPTGCYPAHCPTEFGLSSPRLEGRSSDLLRRIYSMRPSVPAPD